MVQEDGQGQEINSLVLKQLVVLLMIIGMVQIILELILFLILEHVLQLTSVQLRKP